MPVHTDLIKYANSVVYTCTWPDTPNRVYTDGHQAEMSSLLKFHLV